MRSSLILLAAATLLATCDTGIVADQSKVSKGAIHSNAQAADTIQNGAGRFLRSHTENEEERGGIMDILKKAPKDEFSTKKLNKMLTNEAYAEKKFAKWYTKFADAKIESGVLNKGAHYQTLWTQYIAYINRIHGVV